MYHIILSILNNVSKDDKNWQLVFESSAWKGFLVVGTSGINILFLSGEKNCDHSALTY
jgi:hypothetical protein